MAKKLPLITDFDNIPEDALVPEYEQPYEIPTDWKWVRLGSVAVVSKEKTDDFLAPLPYIGLENLAPGGGITSVSNSSNLKSTKSIFTRGDLLYGKLRPYLDKHEVAAFDGVCSTDILVYQPTVATSADFLELWFSTGYFVNRASAESKGINLPRVSESTLANFPVPLPPLAEQKSIVKYLEETNAKIDDISQRLEQYVERAPALRTKLIQAGVNGALTRKWREDRRRSIDDWEYTTLGEAFKWSSGGTPSRKRPVYYTGTIPWIKSGELSDGPISDSKEHISEEAVANSSAKLFPPESVLIAMYGATIGKVGILTRPATTNQAIACALPSPDTIPDFLALFLRSKKSDFIALGRGGAQPNISQTAIKAFPFRLPPKEEQELIVDGVKNGLDKIDASIDLAQRAICSIDTLRQAIVRAALSGRTTAKP